MHYLIDGHNLIAQMPDIDLADPNDEVRLLQRLRGWAAASPKRRLTIFFDGGLGGKDRRLSSGPVTVIFSSARHTADDLLIRRLAAVQDPGKFRLVSSDQAIIAVARARHLAHVRAEAFAAQLTQERHQRQAPPPPISAKEEPTLSVDELAAWIDEFGPVPERQPPPRRPKRRPAKATDTAAGEPAPPARSAAELKESEANLTDNELAEWLALFGAAPSTEAAGAADDPARVRPRPPRRQRVEPRPADTLKESGAGLSQDEVKAWLDIFREGHVNKKKD